VLYGTMLCTKTPAGTQRPSGLAGPSTLPTQTRGTSALAVSSQPLLEWSSDANLPMVCISLLSDI
jgi:hypothetical protein